MSFPAAAGSQGGEAQDEVNNIDRPSPQLHTHVVRFLDGSKIKIGSELPMFPPLRLVSLGRRDSGVCQSPGIF